MTSADRFDLHTHSRVSDGTATPTELVAQARRLGLAGVAITDHDTFGGWDEARSAAGVELEVIPGVEISAYAIENERRISLHLLAYWPDPDHPPLRGALANLRDSRDNRARKMVASMVAAGYPIDWEEVRADSGGGVVGRPHIARALVRAGLVADVGSAFTPEWIGGRGARFYVPKADLPVLEAVALARGAGGVPVFAHPRATRRGPTVSDDVIRDMVSAGLQGLEVDHPDHDEEARTQLRALAAELGLVCTGSSDWHGANKTTPMAAHTTASAVVEQLAAIRSSQ